MRPQNLVVRTVVFVDLQAQTETSTFNAGSDGWLAESPSPSPQRAVVLGPETTTWVSEGWEFAPIRQ